MHSRICQVTNVCHRVQVVLDLKLAKYDALNGMAVFYVPPPETMPH